MASVCVEIAVRDDPRLLDALTSIDTQLRRPDRVLLAASTASPPSLLDAVRRRFPHLPLSIAQYPGGVVEARARAQETIVEEITVFLDSDEVAPPPWLGLLIDPIERGTADFVGGPTRPSRSPVNALERYSVVLERSIYEELVPSRVSYLPLQNTAWSSAAVRRLGFDPRIPFAEDHDLETRAVRAGLRGTYVPDAWVYHDPASAPGYWRWARKRYRYLVAMTMSLVKNGGLGARVGERRRWVHPLSLVESLMRPIAAAEGILRWRRVARAAPGRSGTVGPAS
jgi:GT2 family glycosyltransferase